MSHYLKEADVLWPTASGAVDVRKELPVGTYTVGAHPMRGFFLKAIDDFEVTGKLYGDTTRHADRILQTFNARPSATGVMLTGEKGSGKTMLAKRISEDARRQGISTLVINSPFCGDSFNTFVQEINEPCIIIFDEFEKVYDQNEQGQILTLMDGVFPTKKLFILTCNDRYKVNSHMRNRPGRIYYMIEYKGLDIKFIEEYCNDNLMNKSHVQAVCRLNMLFDSLNFDMLKAIVEEMNRYDESPNKVLEMLNTKPQEDGHTYHNIKVVYNGEEAPRVYPSRIRGVPVAMDDLSVCFRPADKNTDEHDEADDIDVDIDSADLHHVDPDAGTFTYVIEEDGNRAVIMITREEPKVGNFGWLKGF